MKRHSNSLPDALGEKKSYPEALIPKLRIYNSTVENPYPGLNKDLDLADVIEENYTVLRKEQQNTGSYGIPDQQLHGKTSGLNSEKPQFSACKVKQMPYPYQITTEDLDLQSVCDVSVNIKIQQTEAGLKPDLDHSDFDHQFSGCALKTIKYSPNNCSGDPLSGQQPVGFETEATEYINDEEIRHSSFHDSERSTMNSMEQVTERGENSDPSYNRALVSNDIPQTNSSKHTNSDKAASEINSIHNSVNRACEKKFKMCTNSSYKPVIDESSNCDAIFKSTSAAGCNQTIAVCEPFSDRTDIPDSHNNMEGNTRNFLDSIHSSESNYGQGNYSTKSAKTDNLHTDSAAGDVLHDSRDYSVKVNEANEFGHGMDGNNGNVKIHNGNRDNIGTVNTGVTEQGAGIHGGNINTIVTAHTVNDINDGIHEVHANIRGVNETNDSVEGNAATTISGARVTFEEAREGLQLALRYIQQNNLFPGSSFKSLPRFRRN